MLGAVLTVELCRTQVGPCWVHVGATWSSVGTTSAHVRSKLWLGWPILGLCWGYGPLNGSMLAHFEVLLGLCWPIWGLCWAHLELCWGYGRVIFMTSPSFPNFALDLPVFDLSLVVAHLELCWGYGCVIFMMSPSFPNFAQDLHRQLTGIHTPTFRAFLLPPVASKSV